MFISFYKLLIIIIIGILLFGDLETILSKIKKFFKEDKKK